MTGGPATKKLNMKSHSTEVAETTRFLFHFLMPQTQILKFLSSIVEAVPLPRIVLFFEFKLFFF